MSDRTYARDVESTGFPKSGLPDDPNLEMRIARPPNWLDAVCQGCGTAILIAAGADPLCTRCKEDDDPSPPSGEALFPEVATWTDDQLIVAIELADRREPALRLGATEAVPDRYEAFLDACSAELVRRLEEQGVRMVA